MSTSKKGVSFGGSEFLAASKGFSKSVLAANPHLRDFIEGPAKRPSGPPASPSAPEGVIVSPEGKTRKIRKAPEPKTRPEREMGMILARKVREGEYFAATFEGMTIQSGDGMRYTPDFTVTKHDGTFLFVEVKGPFIRRSGLQVFQAAKLIWPKAEFQLWQLVRGDWKKLA